MGQRNEGEDGRQRGQQYRPGSLYRGLDDRIERVEPLAFVVMDLPDQDQRVAHQDAR